LLLAAGVAGVAPITTVVLAGAELVQPAAVTVTEYVPALAVVTPVIDGFCCVEVNPLGPLHVYVAPAKVVAVKLRVAPAHSGPLLAAVVTGIGFITTVVEPALLLLQPLTLATTE
jgi:hypothetical protein